MDNSPASKSEEQVVDTSWTCTSLVVFLSGSARSILHAEDVEDTVVVVVVLDETVVSCIGDSMSTKQRLEVN